MKYMLLIYGNEELWSSFPAGGLRAGRSQETNALQASSRASGEFIGAYGVADQVKAKTVTLVDGAPVVTDGPYIEAKEYLGSFDIVDCREPRSGRSRSRRACRSPGSATVEVRPLMHEAADGRVSTDARDRGPAARARAAGPRRARAPLRALRRRARTRCRRRCSPRPCSGPSDGRARQPAGWLVTVGVAPADRPAAQRRGRGAAARTPTPRWRPPTRGRAAPDATTRPDQRRHADAAVPLLPSGALAGVAARADPARGRRPDHRRDRPRVPRARGDDGPAHQPGQAAIKAAGAAFALPPDDGARRAAARRAPRALPDLQRGLHRDVGPRPAARRPHRPRRSASPGRCTACCPTTARSPACSR